MKSEEVETSIGIEKNEKEKVYFLLTPHFSIPKSFLKT